MTRDSMVEPAAAPSTTAAAGTPLQALVPVRSAATTVATVTAAMWPVLPSATLARSVRTVRVAKVIERAGIQRRGGHAGGG